MFRRLTELRCQQTLEKERIRKDYDKMNAQLDELSKKENFAKTYDFVSIRILRSPTIKLY